MSSPATSAELRLARLLERLLNAAEASLDAGDLEPARATAEEVRAVDPDNRRAARILDRVAARSLGPLGERVLMTLLFSDLVGSTMLSERVEPEQLRDVFSFYRAVAREAVTRYSGYVVQYAGDGILAGFGYPDPHEDDARRAVLAGLDLTVAMRDARAGLSRRLGVAPEVRVGIHTGRVVISELSGDRNILGDSIVGAVPNLAARIQQSAEPGTVVISDVTQQLVDADFYLHSLGERELKGIGRPVEIFTVERPRYAAARFEAERYRKAGLVGRNEPRDRLISAWKATQETPGTSPGDGAFLVVGDAGIGKSRLAAEVLDRAEASGGKVLGVGCLPYYANVSLWPIARLLERVVDVVGDDVDRLRPLETHLTGLGLEPELLVPLLGPLIGVVDTERYPTPQLDPSALLEETLRRLVEWIAALAKRTPQLLVVEDLHWSDPSTLALLGRVVERRLGGVLTVATSRDDSDIPWRKQAQVIELGRLDAADAARLVDNLVAGQGLSDEERSFIVAQGEGNPLFIEELTRSCLDQYGSEPMPLRLQELLTWRLKAPRVDIRVVQVAATVGPTFDVETVSAVVGDQDAVAAQLGAMTEAGIIEVGDPSAHTYRFRHALMRDAAYETQVLDVRRDTHARVAEAMTQRGAEPALIAEHLDLAGVVDGAAALYLTSAQAEQGRGAHTEATRLLTRALDLIASLPESDDRHLMELTARMLRGLSVSSMQGYAAPEVQADHRRAEALTTELGTRPEVLPSLIAIWSYWLVSGELATAAGLIERLTGMVQQPAFSWFLPEVQACAGWLQLYQGNLGSAQAHLERAMNGFLARPSDENVSPFWPLPNDPIAVSAIALACVSTLRGERDSAARWEREALRRANEIGFPRGPFSLAFVKTYAAWVRRFLGDHDAARSLGAEVVAIGTEHGYAYWTILGSAFLATDIPGGAPDREFLRQVLLSLRAMGQGAFVASHLAYLAHLHATAGDLERAHELVSEAIEGVHKSGEFLHLPELLRQRARYALDAGADADQAAADLTEAIRVSTEQGARVARLRAALDLVGLPVASRPDHWRATLEEARREMSSSSPTDETAAADAVLTE